MTITLNESLQLATSRKNLVLLEKNMVSEEINGAWKWKRRGYFSELESVYVFCLCHGMDNLEQLQDCVHALRSLQEETSQLIERFYLRDVLLNHEQSMLIIGDTYRIVPSGKELLLLHNGSSKELACFDSWTREGYFYHLLHAYQACVKNELMCRESISLQDVTERVATVTMQFCQSIADYDLQGAKPKAKE